MINLTIQGRLGNQMFQYAFARALKEKTGQDITIDWHYVAQDAENYKGEKGYSDSLQFFNVSDYASVEQIDYKKLMSFRQYLALWQFEKNYPYEAELLEKQKYEKEFYLKHKSLGLYWYNWGYMDFLNAKHPKNLFLRGTFESPKYFDDIKDIIFKEFTPKHEKLEHNKALYEEIENSESVCVTIRRGDFVGNSFFDVCKTEFFLEGMDIIKEKVPNAKFFIFSNDIPWIKENVNFKYPVKYEQGDDPVWEKLRLMYSCKHFVISNSTFSWWAQYLSRNENKVVVSPDRFFNSEFKSCLVEHSPDFIKIKC